jgi:ribonuclease E
MRDEARPTEAFGWTRPWVPYGDDPFVWFDPSEDGKKQPAPANESREPPRAAAAAESVQAAPAVTRAPPSESGDDMWVELPAEDDKPKRGRSRRGRGRRGAESADSAVDSAPDALAEAPPASAVETTPEPVAVEPPPPAEPEAAPAKRTRSRKKAAAPEAAAPAPEPVAKPEPEPVAAVAPPKPAPVPAEPDPAEISGAPPAAPRKGWWRRG